MANEIHIASMIVHVHPAHPLALLAHVESHPALEVHAQSPTGKVVLVAESERQKSILDEIDALEQCKGVLSCTMVYHEVMTQSEADDMLTVAKPSCFQIDDTQILKIQPGVSS